MLLISIFQPMQLKRGYYVAEGKPHKQGFSLQIPTYVDITKPDPVAVAGRQQRVLLLRRGSIVSCSTPLFISPSRPLSVIHICVCFFLVPFCLISPHVPLCVFSSFFFLSFSLLHFLNHVFACSSLFPIKSIFFLYPVSFLIHLIILLRSASIYCYFILTFLTRTPICPCPFFLPIY